MTFWWPQAQLRELKEANARPAFGEDAGLRHPAAERFQPVLQKPAPKPRRRIPEGATRDACFAARIFL